MKFLRERRSRAGCPHALAVQVAVAARAYNATAWCCAQHHRQEILKKKKKIIGIPPSNYLQCSIVYDDEENRAILKQIYFGSNNNC